MARHSRLLLAPTLTLTAHAHATNTPHRRCPPPLIPYPFRGSWPNLLTKLASTRLMAFCHTNKSR